LSIPGDQHGSASLALDFAEREDAVRIEVDVTSIDIDYDAYQDDRPYIFKIDAESAEEWIWNGAADLLASPRDGIVLLEWTPGAYSNKFLNDLFAWGNVSYIDFQGNEVEVTLEWLDAQTDWAMLVIRKC
jgi:hypothetical protein